MQKFFFCHIPKTAGTTLRAALEGRFHPASVMPDYLMIYRNGGSYPRIDLVARVVKAQTERVHLLRGHYHLNCASLLADCKTIVVLRDPLCRTLSHFKHLITSGRIQRQRLRSLLDKGELPIVDNFMSRFFAGRIDVSNLDDLHRKHEAMLNEKVADTGRFRDEAIEALEGCDYVWVTERLNFFALALEKEVGPLEFQRLNVSEQLDIDLPTSLLDQIHEKNLVDAELYALAFNRVQEAIDAIKASALEEQKHCSRVPGPGLEDFQFRCQKFILKASELFDSNWYLQQNPDVARMNFDPVEHYLLNGAAEGRNPSLAFDTTFYLSQYPDIAKIGFNPLLHFIIYGEAEGRTKHPAESSLLAGTL